MHIIIYGICKVVIDVQYIPEEYVTSSIIYV